MAIGNNMMKIDLRNERTNTTFMNKVIKQFSNNAVCNKQPNDLGRQPLNLPKMVPNQITGDTILSYLSNGTPIWAWYTVTKMNSSDPIAFEKVAHGAESNMVDDFELYRKEGNFLCKYYARFDGKELHMKLYEVTYFTADNVNELVTRDLPHAYEVYHDDDNLAATDVLFYSHDITSTMLDEYLSEHHTMYVTDDHFVRKEPDETLTEATNL